MVRLVRHQGKSHREIQYAKWGALLHDIGKMAIPDHILHKPGSLTDEEWVIMRQHTTVSYETLEAIEFLGPALDIPYCHHEKWNGTGYPRGLKGDEIPLMARLFAVIDVYDALTSDRPYRRAWPEDRVRAHLQEQVGSHFDPRAVSAFLSMLEEHCATRQAAEWDTLCIPAS
jgi:putative nucleotidyltransferase with HDIG domain